MTPWSDVSGATMPYEGAEGGGVRLWGLGAASGEGPLSDQRRPCRHLAIGGRRGPGGGAGTGARLGTPRVVGRGGGAGRARPVFPYAAGERGGGRRGGGRGRPRGPRE